jgi:hypothetical protein
MKAVKEFFKVHQKLIENIRKEPSNSNNQTINNQSNQLGKAK